MYAAEVVPGEILAHYPRMGGGLANEQENRKSLVGKKIDV